MFLDKFIGTATLLGALFVGLAPLEAAAQAAGTNESGRTTVCNADGTECTISWYETRRYQDWDGTWRTEIVKITVTVRREVIAKSPSTK